MSEEYFDTNYLTLGGQRTRECGQRSGGPQRTPAECPEREEEDSSAHGRDDRATRHHPHSSGQGS